MRARSIAVRAVLITAALTTVATSPPKDIPLATTIDATLGPGRTQISVIANRATVNHADFVHLEITAAAGTDGLVIQTLDHGLFTLEHIGSDTAKLESDIDALCDHDRDCTATITIEVPADLSIDVGITATFFRAGDERFVFPDNPPFPDDATVEVVVGP